MAETYIYCLIDPFTDCVRYVGKSNNVLNRLRQHLGAKKKFPVHNWIDSLKSKGEKPLIASLCRVPADDWEEAEALYIEFYKRKGGLLNATPGGDCPINPYGMTGQRGEIARIKLRLGAALAKGYVSDYTRGRMRQMAEKFPEHYGKWANI